MLGLLGPPSRYLWVTPLDRNDNIYLKCIQGRNLYNLVVTASVSEDPESAQVIEPSTFGAASTLRTGSNQLSFNPTKASAHSLQHGCHITKVGRPDRLYRISAGSSG